VPVGRTGEEVGEEDRIRHGGQRLRLPRAAPQGAGNFHGRCARPPAHPLPLSRASRRRGRRPDWSSLFRHRPLAPSEPSQGAMSSSPVARLLLPLLLCAGALGFLSRCHGARDAEAPRYVTVSAASFKPGSTCRDPDPGTRILAI
jgi:hypothetical protein